MNSTLKIRHGLNPRTKVYTDYATSPVSIKKSWRKTEKKIQTRNRNLDCDNDVQIGKNGLSLDIVIFYLIET